MTELTPKQKAEELITKLTEAIEENTYVEEPGVARSYRRGSLRTPFSPGVDRTEAVKHGGNYSIWACQLFDNEADARKSFG